MEVELGFQSIIRQGNHFIAGDDGVWVLIEGPAYDAMLEIRPGPDRVIRLALFPELEATTWVLPESEVPECVESVVEWQDWQRGRWHPGHSLSRDRPRAWVKRREDRKMEKAAGRRDVMAHPRLVDHMTEDYWYRVVWLDKVVRARMRTGFRLLDGKLPERLPCLLGGDG